MFIARMIKETLIYKTDLIKSNERSVKFKNKIKLKKKIQHLKNEKKKIYIY